VETVADRQDVAQMMLHTLGIESHFDQKFSLSKRASTSCNAFPASDVIICFLRHVMLLESAVTSMKHILFRPYMQELDNRE
jgi:hypothetical protein